MGLFDVHAHLTHPQLQDDLAGVLQRAQAAGLTSIISNGLNPADNARVLALAEAQPFVRPAIGFYPVDTVLPEMRAAGVDYPRHDEECTAEEGVAFVRTHVDKAFAVGEIGLDGYWVPEQFFSKQETIFSSLVEIAKSANKPIIIHTRKRERRALELLQELQVERVNWHCFGSKVKLARQIAAAGHYLSIPANARRSESFTRMLQTLPREQLLLETDCPYLSPTPGTRNEPQHVASTLAYAAELWQTSPEAALAQFEQNYMRLFGVAP